MKGKEEGLLKGLLPFCHALIGQDTGGVVVLLQRVAASFDLFELLGIIEFVGLVHAQVIGAQSHVRSGNLLAGFGERAEHPCDDRHAVVAGNRSRCRGRLGKAKLT